MKKLTEIIIEGRSIKGEIFEKMYENLSTSVCGKLVMTDKTLKVFSKADFYTILEKLDCEPTVAKKILKEYGCLHTSQGRAYDFKSKPDEEWKFAIIMMKGG